MALQIYKTITLAVLVFIISSCTFFVKNELNNHYGKEDTSKRYHYARTSALNQPPVSSISTQAPKYYQDIKPIIDNRCVVCHGCYDAPCQLKLSAFDGLERGANKKLVYDGARLFPAQPTRLFVDAQTPMQWRGKNFHSVLNEREQSAPANQQASVLYRLLQLKQENPLPSGDALPDSFDFSLARKQYCPKVEEMDRYEKKYPLWGMPYGLPAISDLELSKLSLWLSQGTPYAEPSPLSDSYQRLINEWENFFNQPDNKSRLMSRYIYEHLFIANLYFDALDAKQHFRLVRSTTPSGQAIKIIPSRRPYDDPGSKSFYYRLQRVSSTLLSKTHLPYTLNEQRLQFYKKLFLQADYQVDQLPSYQLAVASNPFIVFKDLPVQSRYRFLLEEAQFTIMGFIKGAVCRGQVALNVINDRFWVFFISPESPELIEDSEFLASESNNLRLPAESGNTAFPLSNWRRYSQLHKSYLSAKTKFLEKLHASGEFVNMDLIWDGGQQNKNAALTVFRHFDSASVVKGMVGETPKTAWLIGYSLLERIHYLLVAGFDVYGNLSHQLLTRLYMDFLRIEGEFNFLMLLPENHRISERELWYRGASEQVKDYVYGSAEHYRYESAIPYQSDNPKNELFELTRKHLGKALDDRYLLDSSDSERMLKSLSDLKGLPVTLMPQIAFLTLLDQGKQEVFTLISNDAHSNISTLLSEAKNRLPEEDTLTITPGFIGAYPNVFFRFDKTRLAEFVAAIRQLKTEQDYHQFVSHFGVKRNDPNFWLYSDELHAQYKIYAPLEAGLLDYNRLENR